MDNICGKILANSVPTHVVAAMKDDFDILDYLERRQFPTLHLVVLGLVKADLEAQLILSFEQIDKIDWQGRTALSWAAARGDAKNVRLLLRYHANPNIYSFNGSSPLHFASRAPNPESLEPHLAYGADVCHFNSWQRDALAYATSLVDNEHYLLPLLRAGAKIDFADLVGSTALMKAVDRGHGRQVKCLLEHGVH